MRVYFREIHIEGRERVPRKGPFLLVANHPSSFLDPLCIGVHIKPQLNFLAKGVMFSNPIVSWIFRRVNMVPLYRAQDDPKKLGQNKKVFEKCFQLLGKQGVIMIFPEGTSEIERRLRKVKTGAARIALGAEKDHEYALGMKIVPVGLNYTNPHRFRSELFVNFGKPIEVSDYFELYKEDEFEAARQLTEEIEKRIRDRIVIIHKHEHDVLVDRVEAIYKGELLQQFQSDGAKAGLRATQDIADAVDYFLVNDPQLVADVEDDIEDYYEKLKQTKLSDRSIQKGQQGGNLLVEILQALFAIVVGFPAWLYGMINNYLPYRLPGIIARALVKDRIFHGPMSMSFGIFTFIGFYGVQIWAVWKLTHNWWVTLIYGVSLPLSGFLAIYYSRNARRFYYNWLLLSRFYARQQVVAGLIAQRNNIIQRLENAKERYLEAVDREQPVEA